MSSNISITSLCAMATTVMATTMVNNRGRREAPDMTAVNDYLEGCASPRIKCDVEFCQGDSECEAAFEAASNGAKKGTRQFRTTQALVFGVGIFLAWISGV